MVSNDQPFVSPPGAFPRSSYAEIQRFFDSRVPVLHYSDVTGVRMARHVQSAGELLNWTINVGPELFREMTQWAATIYIGKKFVDGFATEAGKDLWAGIKTLGHYIAKNVSKKIEEHRKIALTVTGTEARSAIYVDIAIDIWIPEDNEHVAPVLEAVERVILPLCGCISERNQRLELAPFLIEHDNNWFVSFLGEPSFVIDTGQMEWRLWKSASASKKFVEERAVRCFEACGLQESRDVPFTG